MDQLPRFCSVFACLPLAWFGVQALARASKCEDPSDEGTGGAPGFFVIIIIIIFFFVVVVVDDDDVIFLSLFPENLGKNGVGCPFCCRFCSLYTGFNSEQ